MGFRLGSSCLSCPPVPAQPRDIHGDPSHEGLPRATALPGAEVTGTGWPPRVQPASPSSHWGHLGQDRSGHPAAPAGRPQDLPHDGQWMVLGPEWRPLVPAEERAQSLCGPGTQLQARLCPRAHSPGASHPRALALTAACSPMANSQHQGHPPTGQSPRPSFLPLLACPFCPV